MSRVEVSKPLVVPVLVSLKFELVTVEMSGPAEYWKHQQTVLVHYQSVTMPPHIAQKTDVVVEKKETIIDTASLQLNDLRKVIPAEAFEKSLFRSMYYLLFDYTMWLGSVQAIYMLNKSFVWLALPFWQQAMATIAYWLVAGFFMWCIFVVGHDCGHTNFSNYTLLNDIIGHITHGSLLVPYFPWQVSISLFDV